MATWVCNGSEPLEGRGNSMLTTTEDASVDQGDPQVASKLLEGPHREACLVVPDYAQGLPPVASTTASGFPPHVTKRGFHLWSSGSGCVHAATMIFSLGAVFVKLTTDRLPAFEIVFVRAVICVATTLTVALSQGVSPVLGHKRNWPLLAVRGVVGTTTITSMYLAVDNLPLQDAITIFFTNPAITAPLAWAVLGEQLGWLTAAGCGLSLGGVLLVTRPPLIFGGGQVYGAQQVFGVLMGVVSAVFDALSFVCIRAIGNKEPAIITTLWFHATSLASMLCPLLTGWPAPFVVPGPVDAMLMVGVGIASFFGQLLLSRGIQLEQAGKAASINLMQVLYSYICSVTIFGEHITLLGALGSVMVTSGVLVINLRACWGGRTPKGTSPEEEQQAMLTQALLTEPGKHIVPDSDIFSTENPPAAPTIRTLLAPLDSPGTVANGVATEWQEDGVAGMTD